MVVKVVAQLLALDMYDLAYATVTPMVRANLVVAGLWGIFVFGELSDGATIVMFFGASALVLIGAILLAIYGPQESR